MSVLYPLQWLAYKKLPTGTELPAEIERSILASGPDSWKLQRPCQVQVCEHYMTAIGDPGSWLAGQMYIVPIANARPTLLEKEAWKPGPPEPTLLSRFQLHPRVLGPPRRISDIPAEDSWNLDTFHEWERMNSILRREPPPLWYLEWLLNS